MKRNEVLGKECLPHKITNDDRVNSVMEYVGLCTCREFGKLFSGFSDELKNGKRVIVVKSDSVASMKKNRIEGKSGIGWYELFNSYIEIFCSFLDARCNIAEENDMIVVTWEIEADK